MPLIGRNLHNYLTPARSRDVNGHASDVTIPLDIGHFLLVVLWNQASMASLFWRFWALILMGHGLPFKVTWRHRSS